MLSFGSWVMLAFYVIVLGGGSAVLLAHSLMHKDKV